MAFYACKDNVVCPAFQSTYILDDAARMQKYSYFQNDSTPKFALASRKTKYGVRKPTSLFRKNYEMKTAPKVNVLAPIVEDTASLDFEGEFYASDFVGTDSLDTDSIASQQMLATTHEGDHTEPKYKYRYDRTNPYNHDQEYYNKHYGELLVDNRPPPKSDAKLIEELHQEHPTDSLTTEKKKQFGRGKNNAKEEQSQPEEASESDSIDIPQAEPESDGFGEEEKENDPEETPEEDQ